MNIHFAPLQGYADHLYRRFHAQVYGATDVYYPPFIRIEKGEPRRQDINRLELSKGDGTNLVPQIIYNTVDEFQRLTDAVKDKGYDHIDLNLGCPYPMQTRKGRGAAMITDLKTMEDIAARVTADKDTVYSVKMRLGLESPDQWEALMPILNSMPLSHVTMHPRTATQLYGGEMYTDEFGKFLSQSTNPVVWNGDIQTIEDIDRTIKQYPGISGVMIGRGLLARPSLAAEWQDGEEWSREKRWERLMQFHSLLFDAYQESLCGPAQILQKAKPFWEYLEPEIGHKAYKAIRKASTVDKYRKAVETVKSEE